MVEKTAGLVAEYGTGDIEEMWKVRDAQCPMGHMGDAWNVAYACLYLASEESKYISGLKLIVEGGISLKLSSDSIGLGETTMMHADDVKASIKVCMFDQYGTVVDMQTGLTEAAAPFLAAKGWQGDPNSFVTWWRRIHFENSMIDALLHREHTSYREIGHRSVAFVLERAGIPYTLDEVRDLVAHIERLRPFPEVPEALARLQTRYPLVVLSNGDPDMLETAKRYHGIPFDRVISVAVANAFKPHVATYTKAAEIVGVRMDEVLFIANHAFDCIGAKSAGMRTAFIDRRRRPFGITTHQPDLTVTTMQDLADALV